MFFLGGLHGLPPQRQINGLQRCNSLLCGCQILQGKAVHRLIGRQHGFAAAQAVEHRMGSGELLPVVGGTWDCTAACAGEVVAMTASGSVVC